MTIIVYIGKAAVTKFIEAGFKKAIGLEPQGSTVRDWAEAIALAVFTAAPMLPEPSFEQKANRRFHDLEVEISNLKDDIADLQNEMADFKRLGFRSFLKSNLELDDVT